VSTSQQHAVGTALLDIIRRDQARRSRKAKTGKALGTLLTASLTGALRALIGGWMFMLAVDAMHEHWLPSLPTIGYWWAVWIAWLLRSALSTATPAKSGGDR
jgi:hypothetical protein